METLPKGPPGAPLDNKDMLGTPLDYGVIGLYFLGILAIGTWFGRQQKTAKDFFFGGQRFSWLIAFSLVATTIGSYSFVKYSKVAYQYGVGSSQTYLNDWFWLPLLLFGCPLSISRELPPSLSTLNGVLALGSGHGRRH